MRAIVPIFLISSVVAACASAPQQPVARVAIAADNSVLAELARADQADRNNNDPHTGEHDEVRLQRVLGMLGRDSVRTAEDKFNAALILQHTGARFVNDELVSASPDNYLLAHHLFRAAFEAGLKKAQYLVAASLDRYGHFTAGVQKYGTQRIINQATGAEEWVPIDRAVSDEERARYGVPALARLLTQYPEAKRKQQ